MLFQTNCILLPKFFPLFHIPIVCLVYVFYQMAFCRFLITLNFHVLWYNSCISISVSVCFASRALSAGWNPRKRFHILLYILHLSENTNRKPKLEHCKCCWRISRMDITPFCSKPQHQQNINLLKISWFSSFTMSRRNLKTRGLLQQFNSSDKRVLFILVLSFDFQSQTLHSKELQS